MPAPAVGAQTVDCPVCHVRAGRPCRVRRGYLYEGGVHVRRWQAWMAEEDAEFAALSR